MKPIEAPAERTFSWLSEVDREVVGRLFQSLVTLKEQAVAQTPDPEHVPEGERYSPSLLM